MVLTDIRDDLGERAAASLRAEGHDARYLHLDVTSEQNWAQVVDAVMAAHGPLDILFNNASVSFPAKVEDTTVDIWDRELDVHAKGVFLGTRTAIPAMRKGGGGSIINTSSVMGIVGSPTSPAYSAAKGAITVFTKSAALQYAAENIRINSVHPGYADTPLTRQRFSDPAVRQVLLDRTPMGRLGIALDIANGVCPGVRRSILGHRLGTCDRWRHDGAVGHIGPRPGHALLRAGHPAAGVGNFRSLP